MTPQELSRAPASGRMTAVMRAATKAGGPLVLRVAVVRSGAVIEERTLARREDVVIGPTERSTLVVPERCAPEPFRLLEHSGGRYHLHCAPSMSGRVSSSGRVIELPAEGADRIPLDDGARGRVILGDTTVLFQLGPAPPAPARAPLPRSLRPDLRDDIDWVTTLVAAFSFLIHFGLVGALWSDWMDPVLDDEVYVADLVQSLRALPAPPAMEVAPAQDPSKEAAQSDAQVKPSGTTRGSSGPRGAGTPGSGRMSDARASALAGELRQLDLQMSGALGSFRGAADTVLRESELPMHMLEGAAESSAGAGRGQIAGLSFGDGPGGVVRPGAVRGRGLPGSLEQGVPAGAGSSVAVQRPIPNTSVSPPILTGGAVPNAPVVVAGLRGPFRACYRRGLDEDPMMQGSVRVTAKIGPNGEVISATPSSVVGLSGTVVSCVVGRVAGARFDPPEGGFAILVIPISFVRQ